MQLKSGGRLEGSLVLVGVGARPNVELFKGQLDLLEKAPGGIKVNGRLQVRLGGAVGGGQAGCEECGLLLAVCHGSGSWGWRGYRPV